MFSRDNVANCTSIDDDSCSGLSDASTVILDSPLDRGFDLENNVEDNMQTAVSCFKVAVRRDPGPGELRALAEFAAYNSGIIDKVTKHARIDAFKLTKANSKIRALELRNQVLETREQVLEGRTFELEVENARLKQTEARYEADLAKRSEEVEVCRDDFSEREKEAAYTIRILDQKVNNRNEIIAELRKIEKESLAKDARITQLVDQLKRMTGERNSWRASAYHKGAMYKSPAAEAAMEGKPRATRRMYAAVNRASREESSSDEGAGHLVEGDGELIVVAAGSDQEQGEGDAAAGGDKRSKRIKN